MKKTMTILEKLYYNEIEDTENNFIFKSSYTELCYKQILEFISEENKMSASDILGNMNGKYLEMGYINGFRTCMKMLDELHDFDKKDFLHGILY